MVPPAVVDESRLISEKAYIDRLDKGELKLNQIDPQILDKREKKELK